MQLRVLTLRFNDGMQGFPEQAIREAASGRQILEVRDHFFMHGNVPHLTLLIMLADAPAGNGAASGAPFGRPSGPDPGQELPDTLQKLYRDLRQWRNDRAKKDGLPSYVIMRNTMLAEICRRLPRSLSQLKEIQGIGEATCAKYGQEILSLVAGVPEVAKALDLSEAMPPNAPKGIFPSAEAMDRGDKPAT